MREYHTDVCVYRDDAKCRITPPRAFCAYGAPGPIERFRAFLSLPWCRSYWLEYSQPKGMRGEKKIIKLEHRSRGSTCSCCLYLLFYFNFLLSSFSRPVVFCLKHNCFCFWRCASHHPVIFPRRRLPPCVTWARTDLGDPRNCILAAQPSQSVNEGGGGGADWLVTCRSSSLSFVWIEEKNPWISSDISWALAGTGTDG